MLNLAPREPVTMAALLEELALNIEGSIVEAEIDALSLAGAPREPDALHAHLRHRFGVELSVKELRALAIVTPEMLTPPAERRRGR
jgi:hypothetical protein